MTEKPNPYIDRPLKWLIPEWLNTGGQYDELSRQSSELQKQTNELYNKKTKLGEAIKQLSKGNQVFLLKDGRAIVVGLYGVELVPTTELIATVKKDKSEREG